MGRRSAGHHTRRERSANDRFKLRAGRAFPVALVLSAGVHAASIGLPGFETRVSPDDAPGVLQVIETVELAPIVTGAPPPPELAPPASPELPAEVGLAVPNLDLPALALSLLPAFEPPPPPASITKNEELKQYHSFMPTMVAPELKNRRRVQREFERRIPFSVRDAGIDWRVVLLLWIDQDGTVQKHVVKSSSGSRAFDRAVEEHLIAMLLFRPTLWHGRPIASVVELPFSFHAR
jgi:TonB family protein